jgi:PLP dependent protein
MYRPLLKQRLEDVESRIARAAARSGRSRSDIRLVAVTKKFPAAAIREAWELGLRDFGENYVQEFDEKRAELTGCPDARYHFIGHLQSNKAKKAAEIFQVIHTVDSAKLARRLDAEAGPAGVHPGPAGVRPGPAGVRPGPAGVRPGIDVLIEVKLSNEPAKAGAGPGEVPALVEAIRGCPHLRLLGLMTMPPWSKDAETSRPYFARLRDLAAGNGLPDLSMGMSHDLEVAIEEGATIVRVGTALFGPRTKAA